MQAPCSDAQKGWVPTAPIELAHYCQCSVLYWWLPWDNVGGHQAYYKCSKSRLQKCWKVMFIVTSCQFYVPSFLINFVALFFWSLFSFFIPVFPMLRVAFLSYFCWTGSISEIMSAICYLNVSTVHWFRPWSWYGILMKRESRCRCSTTTVCRKKKWWFASQKKIKYSIIL